MKNDCLIPIAVGPRKYTPIPTSAVFRDRFLKTNSGIPTRRCVGASAILHLGRLDIMLNNHSRGIDRTMKSREMISREFCGFFKNSRPYGPLHGDHAPVYYLTHADDPRIRVDALDIFHIL